jgi:hypothetical protein
MEVLKKYLGIVWMIIGPALIAFLVYAAYLYIDPTGKKDINNPIIWIIIILIFTPVAIGLTIFGWYAWKRDYDRDS